MSRVIEGIKKYHHFFDDWQPHPSGRVTESLPAVLLAGLGAYAFLGGPAVKPKIPADAKQVALSQGYSKYQQSTRGFLVSLREFEAGVDCGGRDPWIGGKRIEEAVIVHKDAEQVVFSCVDSERLKELYGPKPDYGIAPLTDTK